MHVRQGCFLDQLRLISQVTLFSRRAGSKQNAMEDLEGSDCVICMSEPRDTTVLPCRHMCMCNECAMAVQTQTNKCPVCRAGMESLLHIKIQNKHRKAPAAAAGAPV